MPRQRLAKTKSGDTSLKEAWGGIKTSSTGKQNAYRKNDSSHDKLLFLLGNTLVSPDGIEPSTL